MLSPESVVHAFLNINKRLVAPIPRKVLREQAFYCPPKHLQGLIEIERKLVAGENVLPHLSRQIRNPSYNDALLNDWGIHHLHLGVAIESDGFCARTGRVLFARFDSANAYLIDVLPHKLWSLQSLVRKMHNNWPASIERFRVKGALGLSSNLLDKEIDALRKKNINPQVNLGGGVVYSSIGGGYVASGLNLQVVIAADRCARRLGEMQNWVIENIDTIAEEAKKKGIKFPNKAEFILQIEAGSLFAVEINCKVSIPLGGL